MEKLEKPQIICHIEKSVNYSLFDAKWIPCSAKFVVMGSRPRGSGIIQIYEVSSGELKLVKDIERSQPIKCGTFKASSLQDRCLATGDFQVFMEITKNTDIQLTIQIIFSQINHYVMQDLIASYPTSRRFKVTFIRVNSTSTT